MLVNYTVQLTTGDSNGTYNLYYHTGSTYNTATLLSNGNLATGITLSQLLVGVNIVIDDSSDEIMVVNLGTCKNSIIFPIKPAISPVEPPDLCMTYEDESQNYILQFIPNGTQNGRDVWTYTNGIDTYNIIWNYIALQWEMIYNSSITFIYPLNVTIPSGIWRASGARFPRIQNILVIQGTCGATTPLGSNASVTDTNCYNTVPCNGSVVMQTTGGVSPYTYSINGSTYQLSPVIQSLCQGNYIILTKDSIGTISSNSVNVGYAGVATTYTLSLTYNTYVVSVSNTDSVKQTTWSLNVSPSLPIGTTINFNLEFNRVDTISGPGSGIITGDNYVYLNGNPVSLISPIINTYSNPRPNCLPYYDNVTTIDESCNITMGYNDVVNGTCDSDLNIPNGYGSVATNGCITTLNKGVSYQLTNAVILGCSCCSVLIPKGQTILSDTYQVQQVGSGAVIKYAWNTIDSAVGDNNIYLNGGNVVSDNNNTNNSGSFLVNNGTSITLSGYTNLNPSGTYVEVFNSTMSTIDFSQIFTGLSSDYFVFTFTAIAGNTYNLSVVNVP